MENVEEFAKRISQVQSFDDLEFVTENFCQEVLLKQRTLTQSEALTCHSVYQSNRYNTDQKKHPTLFDLCQNIGKIDLVPGRFFNDFKNSDDSFPPRNAT